MIHISRPTLRRCFAKELQTTKSKLLAKLPTIIMDGILSPKEEKALMTSQLILGRDGKEYGWG